MATIGSRRALSAPVDLNRVRLQALLGAMDDALRRLSVQALAPPEWLDAQRCTCWAFAFGRGHFVLEDALRQADEASRRLPPLGAYRRSRDVLAHVLAWLRAQSRGGGVGLVEAVVYQLIADELTPIMHDVDRAPRWLRQCARRVAN